MVVPHRETTNLVEPVHLYGVLENALRQGAKLTIDQHSTKGIRAFLDHGDKGCIASTARHAELAAQLLDSYLSQGIFEERMSLDQRDEFEATIDANLTGAMYSMIDLWINATKRSTTGVSNRRLVTIAGSKRFVLSADQCDERYHWNTQHKAKGSNFQETLREMNRKLNYLNQ